MGVNLAATLPPLLVKKGWTQERLADETGIRRTDVNAIARGRIEVGRGRLERIASALEVSVFELGVPVGEADEAGLTLLDRLAELEETVEKLRPLLRVGDLQEQLDDLARRVGLLERPARSETERGDPA
jgi:transcriptional regulator with XRE-family HTH domain